MNPTLLAIVLLGPPALFGVATAVEDWSYRRQARRRHPSARPLGPEDRPEWGADQ